MATYFIDFQGFRTDENIIIKELCIMDANNILYPLFGMFKFSTPSSIFSDHTQAINNYLSLHHHTLRWEEGDQSFCGGCINADESGLYYVYDVEDGFKMNTLRRIFPRLRLVVYAKESILDVPSNISCMWREHGTHCAYKTCLSMAIDYCKSS